MRIVVVSKTRMRDDRICVGAHDLRDFRSLRLYRHDGTYLTQADNIEIGQVWEVQYRPKPGAGAPHVEDVIVAGEGAHLVGQEPNLAALIERRDVVWQTPEDLFDRRLQTTDAGSAYVPADGVLPSRSTGYWRLDSDLELRQTEHGIRYRRSGAGALRSVRYVGLADTMPVIPEGTLARVSLSRRFAPAETVSGYWLQLSGWY
jgi:hypothetical protein